MRRRCVRVLAVAAGLMLLAGASAAAQPLVERVSIMPRSDGQGYVVRFHTTEPVHAYRQPILQEHGLEVILFNTGLAPSFGQEPSQGPIRGYAAIPTDGHLIFRFELDPSVSVDASAYRDGPSSDLLLGLTFASRPLAARGEPAVPIRSAAHAAGEPAPPVREAAERWRLDTIVIDAGHGGRDAGAVANGIREKDVTLAVAKRVGAYVEEMLGVNVVYTRSDDRFIELKERGRIANGAGAKLFVSIHANAARNRSAHGTETYFLGMHKTEAAHSVMERENSVVQYESNPDEYQAYDEQKLILQTLAQSAYMHKSEQLASFIEQQFAERVGRISRGVKQAGFYVLWSASMPAILVELGFVTNTSEAAFLESQRGQDYLASAIFRAIRDFKEIYEDDLNLTGSH